MKLTMDEKDRLLLSLLRKDSRRPVVALARDLGLSRTATQDRLAKLQASGAIAQFTIIDGHGWSRESAYLLLKFERGARCVDVMPNVGKVHGVEMVHSVTGVIDMVVFVVAESVQEIERARATIAEVPGVAEVSTHVVLKQRTS